MSKAREFWVKNGRLNAIDRKIYKDEIDHSLRMPGWQGSAITSIPQESGALHVIEHSAFQSAVEMIGKMEGALRTIVGFEPFYGLEPRRASETLAELAACF